MVNGRRINLRYAHPGGHNPPIIVIHGNQTAAVSNHYVRYLEKTFRRVLDLQGTPVRVEFKSSENPFSRVKKKDERNSPRRNRSGRLRSEEHTSELQSRGHIVCRLLLEKKNYTITY